MEKKMVFVLVVAVMVLSCAGYSNATVLGTIEAENSGFVRGFVDNLDVGLGYPYSHVMQADETPQYDKISWNVTGADVGSTFEITAETSPYFYNFVDKLTNGIDEVLSTIPGSSPFLIKSDVRQEGLPLSVLESELIDGIGEGVDFEGYTIDSIAMTINSLNLNTTMVIVRETEISLTNYSYDITYTINGAEMIANPEPATVMLLGLGCLVFRRRKT